MTGRRDENQICQLAWACGGAGASPGRMLKRSQGHLQLHGGLFLQGITLGSDDKAFVTGNVYGMIQQKAATYRVERDNVILTVDGQSTPFTIKGRALDGGELGGICTLQ